MVRDLAAKWRTQLLIERYASLVQPDRAALCAHQIPDLQYVARQLTRNLFVGVRRAGAWYYATISQSHTHVDPIIENTTNI